MYSTIRVKSGKGGFALDNACFESCFSHLKTETAHFSSYQTEEDLVKAIGEYSWFYHHERF